MTVLKKIGSNQLKETGKNEERRKHKPKNMEWNPQNLLSMSIFSHKKERNEWEFDIPQSTGINNLVKMSFGRHHLQLGLHRSLIDFDPLANALD